MWAFTERGGYQAPDPNGANISSADLRWAIGNGSTFRGASAQNARFSNAQLQQADFAEAILDTATFDSAALNQAIFCDANLDRVSFVDADLGGASFVGAEFDGHTRTLRSIVCARNWRNARFDNEAWRTLTRLDAEGGAIPWGAAT